MVLLHNNWDLAPGTKALSPWSLLWEKNNNNDDSSLFIWNEGENKGDIKCVKCLLQRKELCKKSMEFLASHILNSFQYQGWIWILPGWEAQGRASALQLPHPSLWLTFSNQWRVAVNSMDALSSKTASLVNFLKNTSNFNSSQCFLLSQRLWYPRNVKSLPNGRFFPYHCIKSNQEGKFIFWIMTGGYSIMKGKGTAT